MKLVIAGAENELTREMRIHTLVSQSPENCVGKMLNSFSAWCHTSTV